MASKQWVKLHLKRSHPTKKQVADLLRQVGVQDITWFDYSDEAIGFTAPNKREALLSNRLVKLEEYLNVEWTDGHYHKKKGSK